MTIYEVLKHEIEALNSIRLPMSELETMSKLSAIKHDLEECTKAIELAEKKQEEQQETELEIVEPEEDDSEG